jgi:L-alanine-DL-glutamate epimerase-like enolase superfamily enzyme
MNKRMLEIAKQAGMWKVIHFPHLTDEEEQSIEQFAELIVQECADIAKLNVMNISTYSDADFVEKQIREHFVVE